MGEVSGARRYPAREVSDARRGMSRVELRERTRGGGGAAQDDRGEVADARRCPAGGIPREASRGGGIRRTEVSRAGGIRCAACFPLCVSAPVSPNTSAGRPMALLWGLSGLDKPRDGVSVGEFETIFEAMLMRL